MQHLMEQLDSSCTPPQLLTSSAGVPFTSTRYFFTTASGSVGAAAQEERRKTSDIP